MTNKEKCIETCNELLRGELSAIETYDQALEKFAVEPEAKQLRMLRQEHSESVQKLSENIRNMGGEPSNDSGAWGTFTKIIQGAAKLMGENSALGSLKMGEEKGKSMYEDALEDDSLLPECKIMIQSELLPRQKQHLSTLQSM